MIRKPPAQFQRENVAVQKIQDLRAVATAGVAMARAGGYYVRGLICWCFALLWGFPALVAGLLADVPTFIGVGTLAAVMAWMGTRMFAKARECRHASTLMPG